MTQVYLLVLTVTDMTKSANICTRDKSFRFVLQIQSLLRSLVRIFVGKLAFQRQIRKDEYLRNTGRFAKLLVSKLVGHQMVKLCKARIHPKKLKHLISLVLSPDAPKGKCFFSVSENCL